MTASWDRTVADHRASTRSRIIAAAMAHMLEHGMAGASMTAIAESAEVSRPTLYKHFPDVDHIMAAVVEEEFAAFRARVDIELAPDWPAIRKLEALIRLHVQQYGSEPDRLGEGSFEAGISPVVREAVQRQLADHHARIVAILQDGIADGSFRDDLDPDLHAELLQHVLGGLRHTVHRTDRNLEALADDVSALLLRGLGGSREPGGLQDGVGQ